MAWAVTLETALSTCADYYHLWETQALILYINCKAITQPSQVCSGSQGDQLLVEHRRSSRHHDPWT